MATRTFTRLYDHHDDALHVVQALEANGVPHADISLVANNADSRYDTTGTAIDGAYGTDAAGIGTAGMGPAGTDAADTDVEGVGTESTGAGAGATVGTVLGGGAGLLAGIGALAIPGVGPIVAAGWLIATLTGAGIGAAGGGILGSLVGAGVPEDHAHVYAEGVRRGGTLVTVRADDSQADRIEAILDGRAPVNPVERHADYQQSGWTGFDAAAPAYTADEVSTERQRRVRVS
jgi:hypothetical protein